MVFFIVLRDIGMIGTNSLSRGSNFLHFSITKKKKNVLSSRLLWDIICVIYQIDFFSPKFIILD